MVDPKEHNPLELQIPFASFLSQTDIFVGQVIEVTSRHVIVSRFDAGDAAETVECIPYNILVVCTGMHYSFTDAHSTSPTTITSKPRVRTFLAFSEQLRRSTSVAVVGGRLVGAELAGRIAAYFEKTGRRGGEARTVTLFEKEAEILPGFPEQAVSYTRKKLEEAGVKIFTSRKAMFPDDIQHSVTSGSLRVQVLSKAANASAPAPEKKRKWGLGSKDKEEKAKAAAAAAAAAAATTSSTEGSEKLDKKAVVEDHIFSLIVDCTGGRPNTDFLKDQFGDALDERGFVKVRSTMQVHKHPFVFAAGDIVSMMDERTSTMALQQANVVAKNVVVMALMGIQPSSSLGSIGKLRGTFIPKQEPFIHYVAGVVNDKDGFVVESHSVSSTSSKVGALKRKNEANAMKFFVSRKSQSYSTLLLDGSRALCSSECTDSTDANALLDLVSPRYHVGVSKKLISSVGLQEGEPTNSPRSPLMSPPMLGLSVPETVILRFCDSSYGKAIAYAMMKKLIPIHPFVRVDQIHEATALLRDAPLPVTITAEMADRQNFSALLNGARCVILPIWPSTDDDDAASMMTHECRAVANAVAAARVPFVIVLCPKTRHRIDECPTPSELCMSCVFESCVEAFRQAVPKRLTVVYVEPEMRNPVLMHTLQAIQLNRRAPLPLGCPEDPENPDLYMSFVAPSDVVEAIVEIHQNPNSYREKEFHLTGTKALTGSKIARDISRSIGEPVLYECVDRQSTFQELVMNRVPRTAAMYLATFMASTTPEGCRTHDMKTLLGRGRRQLSFARWAKQKRALFLSGTVLDDIDLDDVLKKPEAVRELISSVVSGKRIVHTEINESELELEEKIGQGACAVVYKAQYRGATVAVKQFKASVVEFDPHVFRQEVAIISILRHPDLVSCIGACTRNKESLRIVVEYMPRGSLDTFIRTFVPAGPFPLQRQFHFACDIARAMKFLHGIGLIHGDLKPANLLVTDSMQIKLTDFDTCKFLSPKMKSQLGTPDFIPPESFKEKGYTQMVDVYAYGITLWEIATRKQPYADVDVFDIPERVSQGLRPEAQPSHPLYGMMQNCWQEKPQKRPAFVSILEDLEAIAARQGIILRQHTSSHSASSSSPTLSPVQGSPLMRKSPSSSPSSPLLQSSTVKRRQSSGSPPTTDCPGRGRDQTPKTRSSSHSPKEPGEGGGGGGEGVRGREGGDGSSSSERQSGSPMPIAATNSSSSGLGAPKMSMKAMRSPRLMHRQSTPNMRRTDSNLARQYNQSPTNSQKVKTPPASTSPETGSTGTTTPCLGTVESVSPPSQSQSVPVSNAGSPKMIAGLAELVSAEQPVEPVVAEPSHFRARPHKNRFSLATDSGTESSFVVPVTTTTPGDKSSDFLLMDTEGVSVFPEHSSEPNHSLGGERQKPRHKETTTPMSSPPTLPASHSNRKLRVKPPPLMTSSCETVHEHPTPK